MIVWLFHGLGQLLNLRVPSVFGYYSTRMMLAAITSLLLSIFLGPRFIKLLYELKIGQSIRMEECPLLGKLHSKKKDTPTMGGILILFSMLVSMILWMDLTHMFTLLLFITTVVLGLLGMCDDYLKLKYRNSAGLSARSKLLVQGLLSIIVALFLLSSTGRGDSQRTWWKAPVIKEQAISEGKSFEKVLSLREYVSRLYVPFVKGSLFEFSATPFLLAIVALLLALVITGSSNAVNLTDGLDGLAAGSLVLVASTLALFAFVSNNLVIARYLNIVYVEGSGEVAIYLMAFAGACLGFLWYNGHPAQVFMGDTGSLALGGILGVAAVLLKRELLLAIVGGIFVAEAMSVILQVGSYRLRNKRRIFLCAPLHHHFEYKGWPETKVTLRFWIVGLLLSVIGIASLKFQ